MKSKWKELKETIIELRDNNGTGTQQEVCRFLANLMDVLEKQTEETVLDKIKAEIEQDAFKDVNGSKYIFVNRVNRIIDKYKAESEGEE